MTYYSLSLGAGVNSTALLHLLIDDGLPLDEVIFADTGAEKPETYAYIAEWIEPFLKERGIPFFRVSNRETLIARALRAAVYVRISRPDEAPENAMIPGASFISTDHPMLSPCPRGSMRLNNPPEC